MQELLINVGCVALGAVLTTVFAYHKAIVKELKTAKAIFELEKQKAENDLKNLEADSQKVESELIAYKSAAPILQSELKAAQ